MDKVCTRCGVVLTDGNWGNSRRKRGRRMCKACDVAKVQKWKSENPVKYKICTVRTHRNRGSIPMDENRSCSDFLGIHVAEQVLSKVFKDVIKMPRNNPGYDFICNKGKKIDVKSSTTRTSNIHAPSWFFNIHKNKVPDYFLCLAFNNRKSLTPLYLWLLPGKYVNNLHAASISSTVINKWDAYKLNIETVIKCCNVEKKQELKERKRHNMMD